MCCDGEIEHIHLCFFNLQALDSNYFLLLFSLLVYTLGGTKLLHRQIGTILSNLPVQLVLNIATIAWEFIVVGRDLGTEDKNIATGLNDHYSTHHNKILRETLIRFDLLVDSTISPRSV